ncbi:protein DpdD [Rheinheimera sp. UJ63]|uniref:protein DpdD n=1 Tax=Rheinheimera sp. UJ63 TaxID=2910157 RepID=UPI001F2426A2|nr:protein DpdD [Rheinheimera sp. UJ63]MCF4010630.1 hypothetical protein [Rheinheimera sp. UJ63]
MNMNSSNYVGWLDSFFSYENGIEFNKPNSDDLLNTIYPLIIDAKEKLQGSHPFFLASYNTGVLYFYGFSDCRKNLEELRSSLHFGLGTSDTSHYSLLQEPSFEYEREALQLFPHGLIRFELSQQINKDKQLERAKYVIAKILQISKRFEIKPIFNSTITRPVGRILRDFFVACRHQDPDLITGYFSEIKCSGKLSHRNLISLEFQAFKSQKKWKEILSHESFNDYVSGIIPSRIYHILVRAIANSFAINDARLEEIDLELVRTKLDKFQPLLTNKLALKNDPNYQEDWKSWTLLNIILGVENVADIVPNFIDKAWIASTKSSIKKAALTLEVRQSFNEEFKSLLEGPQNIETANALFKYAENCSSSEIPEILDWLDKLPHEIRKEIKSCIPLRTKWAEYEDYVYGVNDEHINDSNEVIAKSVIHSELQPPTLDWNTWFSNGYKRSVNIDLLMESKLEGFDLDQITNMIKECNEPEKIRDISPHLIRWIEEQQVKTDAEFWLSLIELISVDDKTSFTTVLLLKDLISHFLEAPHSEIQYKEALVAFDLVLSVELSRRSLGVIIDFIESLFDYPFKDESYLKYEIWPKLRSFSADHWDEYEVDTQSVLIWLEKQLSPETHLFEQRRSESFREFFTENSEKLKGKKIGISTLTEKAGKRAAEILKALFPAVEVILNHDKVATDKLKNLVKTADYFVFCNKSAAHQSYYAVKDINKNIIYPDGKGSSSIVRALISNLEFV